MTLSQVSENRGSFPRARTPWSHPGGVGAVLAAWGGQAPERSQPAPRSGFVFHQQVAPRSARTLPLPTELAPVLKGALGKLGITSLYSHQAHAVSLALAGNDVVVATPTASGKSLCYHLPVLDAFCRDERACAIYLFPTKALCRDQEVGLQKLLAAAHIRRGAITFDGDTPGDARRVAREQAGVLLTNPDMLHASVLPHHSGWARLFSNLKVVVIDELHSYRGVFGSHLANVLRRLQRIAAFHGSNPVFLAASATVGNPAAHASTLIGRPVKVVGDSGAPEGERHVLVYNPPFVNEALNIRQSYLKTAVRLTAELVHAGIPTLLFGQSRSGVEVMVKYLRDRFAREAVPRDAIASYRGGYLPETRRRIETGLRQGRIRCVVATSALELGIDIGALDAVVCAGFPGTMAGLWQRFGRAGRGKKKSVALLVASSLPHDQFIAAQPQRLFESGIEEARSDPDNVEILLQHLKCGAFEIPFAEGDGFGSLAQQSVTEALGFLAHRGILHDGAGEDGLRTFHWANQAYPANFVSLRSVTSDNFVIVRRASDTGAERLIAELDWRSAHTALHEQAIYQHEGQQFQVEMLDYDNRKAFVRPVKPDYYTTAMKHQKVSVLDESTNGTLGRVHAAHGDLQVLQRVVGYKKIKFYTHENCGYGDVHLPQMEMHTTGCWFVFPHDLLTLVGPPSLFQELLRGLASALHTVAVAGLMVDSRDLGWEVQDRGDRALPPGRGAPGTATDTAPGADPAIFLFDQIAGGIGLAPRLFESRAMLFEQAQQLLGGCACEQGCPACVGVGGQGDRKIRVKRLVDVVVGTSTASAGMPWG